MCRFEGVFIWVHKRTAEKTGNQGPLGIQDGEVAFACEGYFGLCPFGGRH